MIYLYIYLPFIYLSFYLDGPAWGPCPRRQRARYAAHEEVKDAVAGGTCLHRQDGKIQGQILNLEPEDEG